MSQKVAPSHPRSDDNCSTEITVKTSPHKRWLVLFLFASDSVSTVSMSPVQGGLLDFILLSHDSSIFEDNYGNHTLNTLIQSAGDGFKNRNLGFQSLLQTVAVWQYGREMDDEAPRALKLEDIIVLQPGNKERPKDSIDCRSSKVLQVLL
ncbi:hypothetical protein RRG08_012171 [Elysia crispata]|uniref:Uncharacterized protein n=1 Tax=Elysia crispata TaxID=231223 RepID=A0AAE1DH22_9GAST|nr:hypothetical protein RRG08_012171 [Elysia crispata]